jgi:hypothetical protein
MRQAIILGVLCSLLALSLPTTGFGVEVAWIEHSIVVSWSSNPHSVSAVDIDRDGDLDVLASGTYWGNGDLSWWENDGSQNFTEHNVSHDANFWRGFGVDMDSDGDIDILTQADFEEGVDRRITIWVNDGNQNFSQYDIASNWTNQYYLYPTDLDDDGDADIIVGRQPQYLYWLENQGGLNFVGHLIDESFGDPIWVFADDIDGDGDVDVIAGSGDLDEMAWWDNDGSQNFTRRWLANFADPYSICAADVDMDGDKDLLAVGGHSGRTSWFENDGRQNFTERNIHRGGVPSSVFAADLDLDGDMDVLGTNQSNGGDNKVRWWENDGQQSFTEHVIRSNYSGAFSGSAVDFDGDRDLDVLACAYYGKDISWWENVPIDAGITLTPHNPPIQIPPRGGWCTFDGVVTNNTNAGVTVDAWTMVFLPTGHVFGPKQLYQDIYLAPYDDSLKTISQRVKRFAPPGEYTYIGYVGYYPDTKLDSSYFYFTKLESKDFASGEGFAVFDIFGEELELELPGTALLGAYPSPFNVQTKISYNLAQDGPVCLEVFNIQGRRVTTLVDAEQQVGGHTITWDASGYSSGIYFYRLTAGGFTETRRVTLLK